MDDDMRLDVLYLFTYVCLFIKGNFSYYMSETKSKYMIGNLHLLNPELNSGFNQTYWIKITA